MTAPTATLTAFIVGSCSHPECMGLKGGSLLPREFPARAYLIESGECRILWDTGYSPRFFEKARGLFRLYSAITPVSYQHETEGLLGQLARYGTSVKDITGIFVSHFHADHVAGLADFPQTPVYALAEAIQSVTGVSGIRALLKAHIPDLLFPRELTPIELHPLVPLPDELCPFTHGYQLDSAGSVFAVSLPGHAQGQAGCFVRTTRGWELLAFDAAWDPQSYMTMRGPSEASFLVQHSRRQYYETLAKLHQLHLKGIGIHLTHEKRKQAHDQA